MGDGRWDGRWEMGGGRWEIGVGVSLVRALRLRFLSPF